MKRHRSTCVYLLTLSNNKQTTTIHSDLLLQLQPSVRCNVCSLSVWEGWCKVINTPKIQNWQQAANKTLASRRTRTFNLTVNSRMRYLLRHQSWSCCNRTKQCCFCIVESVPIEMILQADNAKTSTTIDRALTEHWLIMMNDLSLVFCYEMRHLVRVVEEADLKVQHTWYLLQFLCVGSNPAGVEVLTTFCFLFVLSIDCCRVKHILQKQP